MIVNEFLTETGRFQRLPRGYIIKDIYKVRTKAQNTRRNEDLHTLGCDTIGL